MIRRRPRKRSEGRRVSSGVCFRGEVVSKAGAEEAVIYADIGECVCECV